MDHSVVSETVGIFLIGKWRRRYILKIVIFATLSVT